MAAVTPLAALKRLWRWLRGEPPADPPPIIMVLPPEGGMSEGAALGGGRTRCRVWDADGNLIVDQIRTSESEADQAGKVRRG